MESKNGFVQAPFLIAIIAGILVLGGGGYLGVRQYQSYQTGKIEKEEESRQQQKALESAQAEIKELQAQNIETQKKQGILEQKIKAEQRSQPKDFSISATELDPILLVLENFLVLAKNQKKEVPPRVK